MGRIRIKQTIDVYEIDGIETAMKEGEVFLGVNSHEDNDALVVLELSSGNTLTISGDDLIEAVKNAMKTGD